MIESTPEAIVDPRPLILTARLDPETFRMVDALRRAHFPAKRNFLAAHLTLFHALPAAEAASISQLLAEHSVGEHPMTLQLTAPMSLGFGVALAVGCDALVALRARLRAVWLADLTAQDRGGWRPHITVQNKVGVAEARTLQASLAAEWQPVPGRVMGLSLWRYDGGPWADEQSFDFAGDKLIY